MDFTMSSSTEGNVNSFSDHWDFAVTSGIVFHSSAETLARFRLPRWRLSSATGVYSCLSSRAFGVPWAEFLTKLSVTFGDLDAAIRQSAFNAGVANFVPSYDFVNAKLVVTMQATKQAGI